MTVGITVWRYTYHRCELIVQRRYSESWIVSGPHCSHSPTLPLTRSQPVIVTEQGSPNCKSQKRHLDNIKGSSHPGLTDQCSNSARTCTAGRCLHLPQYQRFMSPTPFIWLHAAQIPNRGGAITKVTVHEWRVEIYHSSE